MEFDIEAEYQKVKKLANRACNAAHKAYTAGLRNERKVHRIIQCFKIHETCPYYRECRYCFPITEHDRRFELCICKQIRDTPDILKEETLTQLRNKIMRDKKREQDKKELEAANRFYKKHAWWEWR